MKRLFNILSVFVFLFSIFFLNQAFAEEIPSKMNPNSVIEIDDNLEVRVIYPGNFTFRSSIKREYEKLDLNNMSEKEKAEYFEEKRVFQEASEFVQNIPITKVELTPEPGMKVIYDDEGFIDEVLYQNGLLRYRPLRRGTTSPVGTYVWGAHNNTLVVTDNHVTGTGRFTVFTDSIGENGNTLKKD